MHKTDNQTGQLQRLLNILDFSQSKPSIDSLSELTEKFLTGVPFENISKLYYLKEQSQQYIPNLELYIDGIERYNFGGTCYANNYYLHLLLKYLGFDAALCGADMSDPDVHLVNIVTIDGKRYLIDSGYAAPFLAPMPLDSNNKFILNHGISRYELTTDPRSRRAQMNLYRNGKLSHGYNVNPLPRQIDHFRDVIIDSYQDYSTFRNAILLTRFYRDHSIVIQNLSVYEIAKEQTLIEKIDSLNKLPAVIEKYFSIPRDIAALAIDGMPNLKDVWG